MIRNRSTTTKKDVAYHTRTRRWPSLSPARNLSCSRPIAAPGCLPLVVCPGFTHFAELVGMRRKGESGSSKREAKSCRRFEEAVPKMARFVCCFSNSDIAKPPTSLQTRTFSCTLRTRFNMSIPGELFLFLYFPSFSQSRGTIVRASHPRVRYPVRKSLEGCPTNLQSVRSRYPVRKLLTDCRVHDSIETRNIFISLT